jgi:ABC-type multidrug transport system fused ATPase/permease subunit
MKQVTYTRQSIWRLLKLLKPKHVKYILGLSSRVILTTTERLTIAWLLKIMTDAIVNGDKAGFQSTLIGWIAFYVGFVIVAPFILYLWRSAVIEGTANIRESVFHHIQRLPLGYHEIHHSGNALSVLTNDVSVAEKAYQDDLYTLVEASAQGFSAAVMMLLINWPLALLIVLSGLAPLAVNALFAGPLRSAGQAVQSNLGKLSERMTDLLAGYQVVRTFNLGEWILSRFEQANDAVLESSMRRVRLDSALAAGNNLAGIFTFLPMVIGAYLVMIGQTTFGAYIILVQLNNQIMYFMYSMSGVVSRIQSALAAADRILALLDSPLEPERYAASPAAGSLPSKNGHGSMVAFRDVTFAYNGGENILNALSFDVAAGQFVAFAGPSGGGKSTIFKLLLGCYPVKGGALYIAGKPLSDYPLAALRDQIAYVPQDAYLFSGTIYENIRYGKPDASEADIHAAAKAAFAHEFITEFPDGYQTVVGERGARLSGGQRQRIAIARAFLKNAPILLLDEATSALDSESEQIVQRALEVLMRGRTTLVIAHRFSTIIQADAIHVIAGGQVVESGTHGELLAQKGVYANLYDMQFKLNHEGQPAPDDLNTALPAALVAAS